MLASGTFGNDEWQSSQLRINDFDCSLLNMGNESPFDLGESFSNLASVRHQFLEEVTAIDAPIAIWGIAGKGILLAHSSAAKSDQLAAIDAVPDRGGLYLEGSGTRVQAPDEAMQTLHPAPKILVVNPNHFDKISSFIAGRFSVELVSNVSNRRSQ